MRQARQAGFSLVELMVVVVIVGIMAVAAMPAFSDILVSSRHRGAAVDSLRLAHKARALALSTGNAHLLRFVGSDTTVGSINMYVGMTPRCRQTNWLVTFVAASGHGPIETIDFGAYNMLGSDRIAMRPLDLTQPDGSQELNDLWICYQPNGETWSRVPAVADPGLVRQAQPFTIRIARTRGGSSMGRDRLVLFRAGAPAWAN